MRPLKAPVPDWPFRYANMHLAMKSREYSKWNDGTNQGMPATRIYRACMTSPLDWLLLCAVAAVKSDYWRKDPGDWFACGLGGSFQDQTINAAIEWQNLENTGDLRLSELELQQVDLVRDALLRFCAGMAESEASQPLPQPPPPPKPPEPVKPEPKPPEPVKPPEAPKPRTDWKRSLKWLGTLATIASGSFFLWGLVLPPGVREFVKAVLAAIAGAF